MNRFELETQILRSPFDMETHKKTFINYLEVVIHQDGLVEYASPSHSEKMIAVCCEKLGVTRDELNAMVPVDYYCDMNTWLCMTSGCIAVRNFGYEGTANEKQLEKLKELAQYGLYNGETASKEEYDAFISRSK